MYHLPAGAYSMRLTRVGSGKTRLDVIFLRELPNPVEERTWGRIKALYAGG